MDKGGKEEDIITRQRREAGITLDMPWQERERRALAYILGKEIDDEEGHTQASGNRRNRYRHR